MLETRTASNGRQYRTYTAAAGAACAPAMDGTMAATANTATKRAARERMDIENSSKDDGR